MRGHELSITFLDGKERTFDVRSGTLIGLKEVDFDRDEALNPVSLDFYPE